MWPNRLLAPGILSLALAVKEAKSFRVDFAPWLVEDWMDQDLYSGDCSGQMFRDGGEKKPIPIEDGHCRTEDRVFEAFKYDIRIGQGGEWPWGDATPWEVYDGHCALIFHDREQCGGNIVWVLDDVNHNKVNWCVKLPGKRAVSVKVECRGYDDKASWEGKIQLPDPDVVPIPPQGLR